MTDDEIRNRVGSTNNLLNRLRKNEASPNSPEIKPTRNEQEYREDIPQPVRELIGITGNTSGDSDRGMAKVFGVHNDTVADYRRGVIQDHFYSEFAEKVKPAEKTKTETAHELALDAMVGALTSLTIRMPEVNNPKDLSRIASDMSKVSANLREKDASNTTNNVKVVVFAPNLKPEKLYEVLEVSA